MDKRGSAGEWLLVILVMLVIGGIVLWVSTLINASYTKSEVDEKLNIKADKPGCVLYEVDKQRDAGKIDQELCKTLNREPVLRIVSKDISTYKGNAGALAITNYCAPDRLVSSITINEATTTNIGAPVDGNHQDGACTIIDSLNAGTAQKIKENDIKILCC